MHPSNESGISLDGGAQTEPIGDKEGEKKNIKEDSSLHERVSK